MIERTVEFVPYSDSYVHRVTSWTDRDRRPIGRLLILHGVQSHADWYHNLGRVLAERGFDSVFPDRRGSGANIEARGHTPSLGRLLEDVSESLVALRSRDPVVPVGLAGISWGGKLAVVTAGKRPDLVDALALVCPGLEPRVGVSPFERIRIAVAYLTRREKKFPIPLSDPALFTDSPEGRRFIADDPLSLREATAGLLAASSFLDRAVRRIPAHVRQPALLMLAGRDRIVDNAKTRAYAARLAAERLDCVEYPMGHHTLEFEIDPDRYARDLADWFQATFARTSSTRSGVDAGG
ncbi:MAG: alpha/beta fold hydrolase [Isosphaeraceae bacterium]|nr:alpha/beta fold hydrolase [Isosphaeraceae bacterium]